MKKDKNKFTEKGYLVKSNFFNKNFLKSYKIQLYQNLNNLLPIKQKINDNNIDKLLKNLYSKDKKKFVSFYNLAQNLKCSYELCCNSKLTKFVSKLLGVNNNSIVLGDITVRLDNANGKMGLLDWHQESTFYPELKNYKKSILVWFPLTKIKKNSGGLVLLEKSHKKKLVYKKLTINKNPTYPEINKFKINKKYNFVGEIGDVLFINMNTLHKSGKNKSNKFRLSIACRFISTEEKSFVPFKKIRHHSISQIVKQSI